MIFIFLLTLSSIFYVRVQTFQLSLLHLNDIHSYFYESNPLDLRCSEFDREKGNCFGGIARQVAKIKEIRSTEQNVMVLATGDFYMAHSFYPFHGWKLAANLLPYLTLNATSLGNHDFDQPMLDTAAYILSLDCPVIATNLIGRNGSFWTQHVRKSVVFDVEGRKVGVLGYISPETKRWAHVGKSLWFSDEITSLKKEVEKLEKSGVTVIIALGHSSHHVDQLIAMMIPEIDIIIGGNSDIYFHTQSEDLSFLEDVSIHPYPTVIKNNNKTSLLVQVPQHGRHLGHLRVTFDDRGHIANYSGSPILLDMSIKPDLETEIKFNKTCDALLRSITWRHIPQYNDVLAFLDQEFQGHRQECRMRECTLGNMITDAMVHAYVNHKDDLRKKMVDAAVWNAGSIRTSLPQGNLTFMDLTNALYLGDKIVRYNISGARLKKMMEDSVAKYDMSGIAPPGSFLQVSRMKVEYDLSKPPGQRVASLKILCSRCSMPVYRPIVKRKNYNVVLPEYFLRGGDGFFEHHGNRLNFNDIVDGLALTQYLQETTPTAKIEGRITFTQVDSTPSVAKKVIRSLSKKQTLSNGHKSLPFFDVSDDQTPKLNNTDIEAPATVQTSKLIPLNSSDSNVTEFIGRMEDSNQQEEPIDLDTNPEYLSFNLKTPEDDSNFLHDLLILGFDDGKSELDVNDNESSINSSSSPSTLFVSKTTKNITTKQQLKNITTKQSLIPTIKPKQNGTTSTMNPASQNLSFSLDYIFKDDTELTRVDILDKQKSLNTKATQKVSSYASSTESLPINLTSSVPTQPNKALPSTKNSKSTESSLNSSNSYVNENPSTTISINTTTGILITESTATKNSSVLTNLPNVNFTKSVLTTTFAPANNVNLTTKSPTTHNITLASSKSSRKRRKIDSEESLENVTMNFEAGPTTERNITESTSLFRDPEWTTQQLLSELTSRQALPEISSKQVLSESTSQQVSSESTERPEISKSTQKESPESTQKESPESTQKESPESTTEKELSESTSQKELSESTSQKELSESTSQKELSESTSQKELSESTSQKELSESTSQKELSESTSQKELSESTQQGTFESTSPREKAKSVHQRNIFESISAFGFTESTSQGGPSKSSENVSELPGVSELTYQSMSQSAKFFPELTTQGEVIEFTSQANISESTSTSNENIIESTSERNMIKSPTHNIFVTQNNIPESNLKSRIVDPIVSNIKESLSLPKSPSEIDTATSDHHSFKTTSNNGSLLDTSTALNTLVGNITLVTGDLNSTHGPSENSTHPSKSKQFTTSFLRPSNPEQLKNITTTSYSINVTNLPTPTNLEYRAHKTVKKDLSSFEMIRNMDTDYAFEDDKQSYGVGSSNDLQTGAGNITSSNKSSASLNKSSSSSDKFSTNPDKLTASPDKLTASPGKLTTSPNKFSTSPDKSSTSPDKFSTNPDKFSTNPAKFSTNPDKFTTSIKYDQSKVTASTSAGTKRTSIKPTFSTLRNNHEIHVGTAESSPFWNFFRHIFGR